MTSTELGDWLDSSSDPLLLVIGSAISYAAPAGGPRAWEVVAATTHGLATTADPTGRLGALPFIASPPDQLLPESLYAAVHQIYGQSVHELVWSRLAIDPTRADEPRPNAGHLMVAVAAARTNGTVVTTNFDPFLEGALEDLGIRHRTVTGRDVWHDPGIVGSDADEVLVFKVHGDAGRPESLVSKSPDLARTRRVLEAFPPRPFSRALVIGYSGRDLDVFPWLVGLTDLREVGWVDLSRAFDGPHRSELLEHCRRMAGDAEAMARKVLEGWAAGGDERAHRALDQLASAPTAVRDVRACTTNAVGLALQRLPALPGAARWALARAFADIGRHAWAREVLDGSAPTDARIRAETHLLSSFLAASQDRYRDAVVEAENAARSAAEDRTLPVRAALQQRYARLLYETMQIPPAAESTPPLRQRRPARLLAATRVPLAAVSFLLTTVRHARVGTAAIRRASRAEFGQAHPEYRLACDYVETLIRAQAFLIAVLPPLRRGQRRALRHLDRVAHDIGYLTGAVNVSKYLRRLGIDPSSNAAALGRLAVLDDLVPKAIEQRDAAHGLASRSKLTNAELVELDRFTAACTAAAREAGVASLELQALTMREQHGLPTDPGRAAELLGAIQIRTTESLPRQVSQR